VARNYYHFGRFIPISTNGGINLYIGNNPYATGEYRWDSVVTNPLERLPEYERDKEASRLAKKYMKNHPLEGDATRSSEVVEPPENRFRRDCLEWREGWPRARNVSDLS